MTRVKVNPTKLRHRCRRAGVALAGIVSSLLLGLWPLEAWFRAHSTRVVAVNAAIAGFFVESDPELLVRYTTKGRRLVPDARVRILHHRLSGLDIDMQINSLGFRGHEISPKKVPGEFRALVLGDSITWGDYLPSEQVYVECAERLLNASSSGRRVEVINAGVGDVGIEEEMYILQESGLAAKPDLVVLGFYLNDSRPPWGFAGELGHPGWLRRHSVLAAELYRSFKLERWFREQGELRYSWIGGLNQVHWRTDPASLDRLAWMARFDWGAAWQPDSWAKVDVELERLRSLSEKHGFRVLVMAFPVRYQVEAEFVDDGPQRTLAERARANGFGFLDLLPLLRAHRGEPIYFDHCHPKAAANAWIGEALAKRIQSDYLDP